MLKVKKRLSHVFWYDMIDGSQHKLLIQKGLSRQTVQSIMGAMEKRRSSEFRAFSFSNAFTRFSAFCAGS